MLQRFDIDFSLFKVKGDIISFPFYVVIQTTTKGIEEYCRENWPNLLDRTYIHSREDKLRQIKMEKYIKETLLKQKKELDIIHNLFYEKRWFGRFKSSDLLSSIQLHDFDAKTWTNPEIPYLELKGEISINLNKVVDYYFRKNLIKLKRNNKFVKEEIILQFISPLPLLLTYMKSQKIKDLIVKQLENLYNRFEKNYEKYI